MNQEILQGKWKQIRGEAQSWWGKLTNDDLDRVEGKVENFREESAHREVGVSPFRGRAHRKLERAAVHPDQRVRFRLRLDPEPEDGPLGMGPQLERFRVRRRHGRVPGALLIRRGALTCR